MDGIQIFRWGKMCDAQLDATQILASPAALAESGVQNRPTLARVENSNAVHLRRFSYSQKSWLSTRGGSEVLGKSRLPPSIPSEGSPKDAALSFASLQHRTISP